MGFMLFSAAVMAFIKDFQSEFWCDTRNLTLAAAVAFGLLPSMHWAAECEWKCTDAVITGAIAMFLCYFIGFVLFTTKFPERLAPGKFDLFFHSHALWHCFVWAAGAAWLEGVVNHHGWRMEHSPVCPMQAASL